LEPYLAPLRCGNRDRTRSQPTSAPSGPESPAVGTSGGAFLWLWLAVLAALPIRRRPCFDWDGSRHERPFQSRCREMFTIWLPFQLPTSSEIAGCDIADGIAGSIEGYPAAVRRTGHLHVLTVARVASEPEADVLLKALDTGLRWAALLQSCGIKFELTRQTVKFAEDPERATRNLAKSLGLQRKGPTDGIFDGGQTAIYEEEKHLVRLDGGLITFKVGLNADLFLAAVAEAAAFPNAIGALDDKKLRVAIDLFCSSLFFDEPARFILQCCALETAAPESKATPDPAVTAQIDRWKTEAAANQALVKRLDGLMQQSHGQRIRKYVCEMLSRDGHADAETAARDTTCLYNSRSRFMHQGKDLPADAGSRLHSILQRTLISALRRAAGGSIEGSPPALRPEPAREA
jgi:hypothetical protein